MRTLNSSIKLLGKIVWPWFIPALGLSLMMVALFTTKSVEAG
ncbi:hypothetical protein ACFLUF_00235 [Chloroflexota bacterium]